MAGDDSPMLVVLMVLGYLGRGWLSRPVGGTAAFRDALIDRYASLGGVARVNTTVEEILVADHLETEEWILFPVARLRLTSEAATRLAAEFRAFHLIALPTSGCSITYDAA